jgi:gamma-polyglutamate synthase
MKLIVLLLFVLIALGVWETLRLGRYRRRIPIRVHVNGSRGKSSVARLIAAGLRGGGLRVVAKTTGSAAVVIHTDGSESPVMRRGGPNIREQLKIIRDAVTESCEALVIECMAIRPDLQKTCEHHIVHATHGVITNVRPDHLEIMGPSLDDVAASLAGTIPRRAHLFHAEDVFASYFGSRALALGSRCTRIDGSGITPEDMAGFGYIEFPENVELALAVCESAGVARDRALKATYGATPDVGAMTRWRFATDKGPLTFVNGFAANDPMSYVRIWQRLDLYRNVQDVVLVYNNRSDRMRRAKDMLPLFGRELPAGRYVLIGESTGLLVDMLRRQHLAMDRVEDLAGRPADELWAKLVELSPDRGLIIGIGNIKGIGNELLGFLRNRIEQEVA